MSMLALSMVFWVYVLAYMDVGKAYPMLSVNYVIMLVLSRVIFNEAIPVNRVMGMLLIVGGVVLVGWS
jgi:undecaprenyl phosphate-alpha-L-ara4N flippase subunit ArnE